LLLEYLFRIIKDIIISNPSSVMLLCIDSVLQQLRSLVAVNETFKKQESDFRESCKVQCTFV